MSTKRSRRSKPDSLSQLCSELGEDDGVDPKQVSRDPSGHRATQDRKTLQLCRQVACAVDFVLGGQTADDDLSGLLVASVVPTSHRGHLLVTVMPGAVGPTAGGEVILAKLRDLTRRIRAEVGSSITRRKVPELSFAFLPFPIRENDDA